MEAKLVWRDCAPPRFRRKTSAESENARRVFMSRSAPNSALDSRLTAVRMLSPRVRIETSAAVPRIMDDM